MKTFIRLFTLILTLPVFSQTDGDDIVIGKYRKLYSSVTNEDRTLLVWLPRSYSDSVLSYPVVYLLYGQNTSECLLPTITACDLLSASGAIPEMIIVGVASAERYRDYSSIADGYVENTVKFFTDELFPFIESNYRTKNYRVVIGPQAGAVFSFYTLLKHPGLFNAYILDNPFVWQNRELLYRMATSTLSDTKSINRFLFIKDEKESRPESLETAGQFSEWLKTNTPEGFRFHYCLQEPSGYFVPPVPAKEGLQKLFERYALPADLKVEKVEDIIEYYQKTGNEFGSEFNVPEHVLTMESDILMEAGKFNEQAELLLYMLSIYPHSLNALLRMGDLKRMQGEYQTAIAYYDKFLDIMPTDAIAIRNRRNGIEKYISESLVYTLEKDIQSIGIDKAVRNFKRAKDSGDNKLTCEENDLNTLGYTLLNRQMNAESIKVFKLALDIYPESANLYDSLGETYMKIGDNRNAIINYEKSLDLNPANNNARGMLEKLKK
ncbi:MAG: alpha/beta hydrolase-fold protein [Bacteroidales bacterium]|nr:alpha/beta hydrolase-fold protein [Bacteroidales bacterium]